MHVDDFAAEVMNPLTQILNRSSHGAEFRE